jgi:GH18 family chitinase
VFCQVALFQVVVFLGFARYVNANLYPTQLSTNFSQDQEGILSYDELTSVRKRNNPSVIFDQDAAVKYFSWPQNQWASYDDEDTLKLKVDFAGKMGYDHHSPQPITDIC